MNPSETVRGLYVITDPGLCGQRLQEKVAAAIEGGAQLVQYRNKDADRVQQAAEIHDLMKVCAGRVPLIVNDDADLALETGADGVHVGQDCADLAGLRTRLGAERLLGVTCHASVELAQRAQDDGADYVAFGAFFPSPTKPHAPSAPLALLAQAREVLQLPIVAIGGINADNAQLLRRHGADCIAVISGVFGAQDSRVAAQQISAVFTGS